MLAVLAVLVVVVGRPTRSPVPALGVTVRCVLSGSTKEEVVRVTALWDVAGVAHLKTLGNRTTPQHVRRDVSPYADSNVATRLDAAILLTGPGVYPALT
jgi:hypothetical protein